MKNNKMTSGPAGYGVPVCPGSDEGDVSFDDLQPVFDEQSRRLDAVVGDRVHLPRSLDFAGLRTQRRLVLRRWCLLAVVSAAVAVYWGIDLWHHNFDIYYRLFTLFLEAVFIGIVVDSFARAVSIGRGNPARVGLGRRSRRANPAVPSKYYLSVPVNIGIAASIALIMVACATGVGDGYTMSQDHNARLEAINNVTSILNNI